MKSEVYMYTERLEKAAKFNIKISREDFSKYGSIDRPGFRFIN